MGIRFLGKKEQIMKQEKIYAILMQYVGEDGGIPEEAIIPLAVELEEASNEFKSVWDKTPPSNTTLLVKSPKGEHFVTTWRSAYEIFSVQEKGEISDNWQWKLL